MECKYGDIVGVYSGITIVFMMDFFAKGFVTYL